MDAAQLADTALILQRNTDLVNLRAAGLITEEAFQAGQRQLAELASAAIAVPLRTGAGPLVAAVTTPAHPSVSLIAESVAGPAPSATPGPALTAGPDGESPRRCDASVAGAGMRDAAGGVVELRSALSSQRACGAVGRNGAAAMLVLVSDVESAGDRVSECTMDDSPTATPDGGGAQTPARELEPRGDPGGFSLRRWRLVS